MTKRKLVRKRFLIALTLVSALVMLLEVFPFIVPKGVVHNITLSLSTPKREYMLGDEIPIIFSLKNNGKATFPETAPWYQDIPFLSGRSNWEEPSYRFDLSALRSNGRICFRMSDVFF